MKINRILHKFPKNENDTKEAHKTQIKMIMDEHESYCLISDDKTLDVNYNLKFVDLLKVVNSTKQLIIHPSKFIFFAWQGLINVYDYKVIIINCQLQNELIHAFKVFYISNIAYDIYKPYCVSFIKNPTNKMSIFLQSSTDQNFEVKSKKFIKMYEINLNVSEEYKNYVKCRRILKKVVIKHEHAEMSKLLDTVNILEQENVQEAINLLNVCTDLTKIQNIEETEEDNILSTKLWILNQKLEIIKKYIKLGLVCLYGDSIKIKNTINYNDNISKETKANTFLICIDNYNLDGMTGYKKIILFKQEKSYSDNFINEICKNHIFGNFINYEMKKETEFCIGNKLNVNVPTLSREYSIIFFEHVLYMINRLFHENFLFIKCLLANKYYKNGKTNTKFYCFLEFPKIVDNIIFYETSKSDEFSQKKEANKDVSYKFIIKLVENGFLDKNFLPVKQKFINNNKFYIESIKKVYNIDFENIEEAHSIINELKEEYEDDEQFKRDFAIDIFSTDVTVLDDEEVLKKQPECLRKLPSKVSLYIFDNGNLGICTGEAFKETVTYRSSEVRYIKDLVFTEEEKEQIYNYQVLFFGVNFKRILCEKEAKRKYEYLVVPMKNDKIDFEYLKMAYDDFYFNSVIEISDDNILDNFLLYNPISKLFYEYTGKSEKKLTDTIKYSKAGRDTTEQTINKECTFLEYFKRLYGINLSKMNYNEKLVIYATPYSTKKTNKPEYHSGEVLYVTTIKKTIKKDYKRFIEYFNIFETLALAHEFKEKLGLKISIDNVAVSFTQKTITEVSKDLGYERFEFIGDSFLKYATSKFLFTECHLSLNRLVSTKDSIICNNNLYKIARSINLHKYFSLNKYSVNLFQPPSILDKMHDMSIIKNLCAEKVFQNSNQDSFVREYSQKHTKNTDTDLSRKVYADIIEALIGVYYAEKGPQEALNFIVNIGILDRQKIKKTRNISSIEETMPFREIKSAFYMFCDYEGILSMKNIVAIEKIINYTFKNKGLIEKAMIHPSYSNNLFGSERFQKLELIGDCFLDLQVSNYIFFEYTNADPECLHTHRKSLVNNHTFALILFETGLFDLSLTGLSESTRNNSDSKISKCYSDIFESMVGAVVLDSDFDLVAMKDFFKTVLNFMIKNSYEC